jgi:DNA-binding transcriptional ArsR family regulator
MGSRAFKDSLYAEFAVLGKALANSHRLELLDLLAQAERSVEQLANEALLSLANASAHLQVLRQARLVEAEKRGLNVVYRLAAPEVFELWGTLRAVGSTRLAEIDRFGTLGINFRARKATDEEEWMAALAALCCEIPDGHTEAAGT